ncbi:MAG: hypothetical protein M3495_19835 [Pseudomonadota bacterium]|nr:hypothetical protein [Pseudomonadota bacterium]
MILVEHGKRFEAWRVIEGRNSGKTILAVSLYVSKFQRGDGKLELPYRVPKPELGTSKGF